MKAGRFSRRAAPSAGPIVELRVDEVGARGDGVATLEGRRVFVPLTAPGEQVRAQLGPANAEGVSATLVEILAPSSARRVPPCVHFAGPDLCGGCTLQQLDPAFYRQWQRDQVRTALRRQGLDDSVVEPVAAATPGTRRRAVFAAARHGGRVILGFNQRHSSRLVDIHACLILDPRIMTIVPDLRQALTAVIDPGETADIAVTLVASGLDIVLSTARPLSLAAREALADLAERCDIAQLSWAGRHGVEPVAHRRPVTTVFAGVPVGLAPGAFIQATPEGEQALVAAAVAGIGSALNVVDLFAGSGTFTFPLAAAGRCVHAVDGEGMALDALQAAARTSRMAITAEKRDLFRNPLSPGELSPYQAALFDPPRAGARQQAEMLGRSGLQTVVGVSCNPATFARDARLLCDGGFSLGSVLPVDQFLWSAHIEIVGNFTRVK